MKCNERPQIGLIAEVKKRVSGNIDALDRACVSMALYEIFSLNCQQN